MREKVIKLSPFVKKVKGAKNYALFDFSKQELFIVTPDGSVDNLKEQLIEAGLVFETSAVVPFTIGKDVSHYREKVVIRELQIRITGDCNQDCSNCGNPCCCFKGGPIISDKILDSLFKQIQFLPIERVLITGGDPSLALDTVKKIKDNKKLGNLVTAMFKYPGNVQRKKEMDMLGIKVVEPFEKMRQLNESEINPELFNFCYSKKFNPCWGNKVAVDSCGSIKPCLWSNEILGNVLDHDLKTLILDGAFDKYWLLTKDKIDVCSDCEYRYGCRDCRVLAIKEGGSVTAKYPLCSYTPSEGKWE